MIEEKIKVVGKSSRKIVYSLHGCVLTRRLAVG
jgi:hypothetical protein